MSTQKSYSQNSFEFQPIGYLESCFKEKFGIPRQPGLVKQAKGMIKLMDHPNLKTAVKSLETFSHIWLIFVFHQQGSKNWKPSVRPPRLGGTRKVGVLASRSPHRPNPIGLSAVELEKIDLQANGGPEIHVRGVDLLDGTPILDLKPYLSYADSIPNSTAGWAQEPIDRIPVDFELLAHSKLREKSQNQPQLQALIIEILSLDPRPAFQKRQLAPSDPASHGTRYGFKLFDFDVKWEIRDGRFVVLDLQDLPHPGDS